MLGTHQTLLDPWYQMVPLRITGYGPGNPQAASGVALEAPECNQHDLGNRQQTPATLRPQVLALTCPSAGLRTAHGVPEPPLHLLGGPKNKTRKRV